MYKYPVRTAQLTHSVSVIKPSQLMLYREIIAFCSQIHTKHINTQCGQNVEFVNVKHIKHWALECLTTVLTPATYRSAFKL